MWLLLQLEEAEVEELKKLNQDPQLLGLLDPLLLALQLLLKLGLQLVLMLILLLLLVLLHQDQLAQNQWALVQDPEVGLA